jgi:hypothetical protein
MTLHPPRFVDDITAAFGAPAATSPHVTGRELGSLRHRKMYKAIRGPKMRYVTCRSRLSAHRPARADRRTAR